MKQKIQTRLERRPRDWRFFAANIASAGLLISAVKFPLLSEDPLAVLTGQLELGAVVALMDRVPGAGLVAAVAAALSTKFAVAESKALTDKKPFYNKMFLVGSAGLLSFVLFLDKRGFVKVPL
uniref:Uncharacterized protein n=1 Tax=Lotharella oceanica TaxID=641309 RepID=A0A7S2TIS8_9EUKA|mmetsp:Transcript_1611/g.3036  ORF Transcript_1611/g.3036 Transcript_1611/m.3036 type:complete len:123 (+) Transcript_1611:90-458(+)|eukprot:CAMPEP_0170170074 /NCGR_PEP_ID=MMETSP0040_2-20121228/3036_1 /TAXON_ID=641309 /ORGANISM="Lotharella oceanica, Strain CCMP622" /LENGTH=122 /DNA_ID=CAMNT_0010409231 /DNA_START=28 /DNA_END=396 /DNA_ORIENTATION=+